MMDHITVKGQGGTFAAYIARPKALLAPAVVVLQVLFGVSELCQYAQTQFRYMPYGPSQIRPRFRQTQFGNPIA